MTLGALPDDVGRYLAYEIAVVASRPRAVTLTEVIDVVADALVPRYCQPLPQGLQTLTGRTQYLCHRHSREQRSLLQIGERRVVAREVEAFEALPAHELARGA